MLSYHGKQVVSRAMYEKGRAFIGAAILVNQHKGNESVVLHLLCQGLEVVLKALLLAKNYDAYKPKLVKLGHNLVKVAAAARTATGLHIFTHGAHDELVQMNKFYSEHLLRYASNFDIFIDPSSIPHRRIFRHTIALVRYIEKKGIFSEGAI